MTTRGKDGVAYCGIFKITVITAVGRTFSNCHEEETEAQRDLGDMLRVR